MIARDGKFGQLEPAASAATDTPPAFSSLGKYFLVAVSAGVTVWFITRWLGRKA